MLGHEGFENVVTPPVNPETTGPIDPQVEEDVTGALKEEFQKLLQLPQ